MGTTVVEAVWVGERPTVTVIVTTGVAGLSGDLRLVAWVFSLLTSFFPQAGSKSTLDKARSQNKFLVLVFKGVLPVE